MYRLYLHPLFHSHWIVAFSHWLQATSFISGITSSNYVFPFVQLAHFTGLSLWVGTSIAFDFRLLGYGQSKTPAKLLTTLIAWNWVGLIIAIFGGVILFGTAAANYVVNAAFELKLGFLIPAGILLHIYIQAKTGEWSQYPEPPGIAKLFGLVEMVWWLGVVTAAVSIPYSNLQEISYR